MLGQFLVGLFYCTLHETAIEDHPECSSNATVMGVPYFAHITPVLYKMQWHPIFFWMQVITFKAVRGYGTRLLIGLPLPEGICLSHQVRVGLLHVPSLKCCHLVGPRRHALYVPASACETLQWFGRLPLALPSRRSWWAGFFSKHWNGIMLQYSFMLHKCMG